MIARRRPQLVAASSGGNYFADEPPSTFIRSGCTLLDCVLTGSALGSWPLGRITNIVGDKSTGKTLLAIEATANFARQFPKGKIYYREAEAAFDTAYAATLGLPTARVDFGPKGVQSRWATIEDVIEDMNEKLTLHERTKVPGLYILDSLDATSSRASLARKVGQDSYNLEKQKAMSLMFSELTGRFASTNMALIIVSQVRSIIGFTVGEKHRRSGGDALNFYASLVVWLKHLKQITRTENGVKRVVAIRVQARCKKNKIAMPFRECTFAIRFGYGIDDIEASLLWLQEMKMLNRLSLTQAKVDDYLNETDEMSSEEYRKRAHFVRAVVNEAWQEIEARFAPPRRKYA